MTTETATLADFLLARIDEDEAQARDYWDDEPEPLLSGTWLHWVVSNCAALRAIVALHSPCDDWSYGDPSTCPELRAIAAIWADNEDYRAEWVAS